MGSRLVNVRLDEVRARKARRLRTAGVTLSDVVRDAIDARYDQLNRPVQGPDVRSVLHEILERYPDHAGAKPRPYDVHDRRASRTAIVRILKRRR
ncbi:MAG TPA: hypothetical protein VMM93_08035 [Vicinamibacterales bacterium]|nr:hypothetical protein [Vicinamibacterales bacterium]